MNVGEVIDRHRLVVCVGTGGVGKTTLAAAMAVGAAVRGRRAMVLTIDPAHQLARALGLEAIQPGGERVAEEVLARAGAAARGTLDAAMLDQKNAWDAMITRHAPSPQVRDTILANPFYKQLSSSFAGATEYAAMEELCRLDESRQYDLIVLDTPPTGGALDFLRAPERLDHLLLDRDVVGWLARPFQGVGKGAWQAVSATVRMLLRRLERATGSGTLRDISAFFVALEALFGGMQQRTTEARALLHGEQTAFVLVTGPDEQVLAETRALHDEVSRLGAPLRAVVLNRAHPLPAIDVADEEVDRVLQELAGAGADLGAVSWLSRTHAAARALARTETAMWKHFESALPAEVARTVVPEGERDLHSMADLKAIVDDLWG